MTEHDWKQYGFTVKGTRVDSYFECQRCGKKANRLMGSLPTDTTGCTARHIPDRAIDGAVGILREQMNDGADGESAHLVCDAITQLRRDLVKTEEERNLARHELLEKTARVAGLLESDRFLREKLAAKNDPNAALAARIFKQCAKVCRERGEAEKQHSQMRPGIGAHFAKAAALGCEAEIHELATKWAEKAQQRIKCDYGDECPGHASPDDRPCGWEPPSAQLSRFSFTRKAEAFDAVLSAEPPGAEIFSREGDELKVRDGVLIAPDEMVAPDGRVVHQDDVLTARAGVLLINGEAACPDCNGEGENDKECPCLRCLGTGKDIASPEEMARRQMAAKAELARMMAPKPERAMDLDLWLERMWKITDGDWTLEAVGPLCIEQGLRWLGDRAEELRRETAWQAERAAAGVPDTLVEAMQKFL